MPLPAFAWVVLRHGSYYLFLERSEKSKHWPLHWTIPWGKIEIWEDPLDCAIRETLEEVGVRVHREKILQSIEIIADYIDGEKRIYLYLTDTWEGMPENLESDVHNICEWRTLDELPYPMIPHIWAGIEWMMNHQETIHYHAV